MKVIDVEVKIEIGVKIDKLIFNNFFKNKKWKMINLIWLKINSVFSINNQLDNKILLI